MTASLTQVEPLDEAPRPIVVAKFTLADALARGQWLIGRLHERWPQLSDAAYAGKIRQWIGDNLMHFVATDRTVALAMALPDPMSSATEIRILFILTVDPKTDNPTHANRLAREIERWAKGFRATRLTLDPDACDFSPGQTQKHMSADTKTLLIRNLETKPWTPPRTR